MRCGRWASTVRHKFQLGLLVPARPGVARRQRVWAEPVRRFCASQAEQFDKAPDAQTESEGAGQTRQNRVLQPVRELVEQARRNEEREKNGTSHQALLLRSCSRLIEAAAKRHAKKTVIGMMTICGNSEASPVNRIDAEMTTRLMASGPPMPRIMIRIASNSSTEIMPQRMLSVASQYLAQLMRPSKRNRNQK